MSTSTTAEPSDPDAGEALAGDLDDVADELAEEFADDNMRDHVVRRTLILPEHKVLFMPTPKAACTTIMWQLARLAGLQLERFDNSGLPEVSTALTIHDMNQWDRGLRYSSLEPADRARIQLDDTWFRFTVVRDPATRLWSAWQSKLLLREPRFVADFGEQPWFPRLPGAPEDVVEDFRKFVMALTEGDVEDVHWALQHELLSDLSFNHIGRTEALGDTIAALTAHLSAIGSESELEPGRENRTPLRMPASAYDAAAADVLNTLYAPDQEAFGYAPVEPGPAEDREWSAAVAPTLPVLRELIDRTARIGQLSDLARERGRRRRQAAQRVRDLEEKLAQRNAARAREAAGVTNLEGLKDFDVRWAWQEGALASGFTAVVRVKNEAQPLPWVLPPLFRAVKNVVLVDNGSSDGTPDLAFDLAREAGAEDRLRVVSYPFDVARCGAEHLGTPAASVHSLTYFYNWAFSQVRTTYALKWDGDMVLTESGVQALQDLEWQLEASHAVVTMRRYPLYIADERTAFLDVGLLNNEPWAWPNHSGFTHVKAMEWELPLWPEASRTMKLPDWSCVELKWLNADEFAHWSDNDFSVSARTRRKQREWSLFQSLKSGDAPPEGVVRVEAPDGRHVIDYFRETWLARERSDLSQLAERLDKARRTQARIDRLTRV